MTKPEKIELITEKIKGMRNAYFITTDAHGHIHGRPMSTQDMDEQGDLWFMTSKDSKKIQDIEKNPQIGLIYGHTSGTPSISISGTALLSNDREKIKELWNDLYKAWFENENDPNIVLIKVSIIGAEYWEHAGGRLGAYIDLAAAAITGNVRTDHDEHEKIKIS